jgi:hypothetical protein
MIRHKRFKEDQTACHKENHITTTTAGWQTLFQFFLILFVLIACAKNLAVLFHFFFSLKDKSIIGGYR